MAVNNMISELAGSLELARENRQAIKAITSEHPEIGIADAYAVQFENIKKRLDNGELIVGKKIGLTSKGMQNLLGVFEPDYGHILDTMVIDEGDTISFERHKLLQPKVEGEIAFILKEDLKGPGITVADVYRATLGVVGAIEVVDSRVKDWKIKIQDTIADNASSAYIVIGSRMLDLSRVDLKYTGMVLEKNGQIVNTGAGAAVMGNPAAAVAWLANKLSEFDVYLKSGEIVLAGALTAACDVKPGDCTAVTFDRLGSVSVKFDD